MNYIAPNPHPKETPTDKLGRRGAVRVTLTFSVKDSEAAGIPPSVSLRSEKVEAWDARTNSISFWCRSDRSLSTSDCCKRRNTCCS